MTVGKHTKRRIRILVKAFPQHSKKYEETVCCAGVTEDAGELLRLFPIRFRRLPRQERFDRFDLVEMTITKASDPRPESYRVDEASIKLLDKGRKLSAESKIRLWAPFVAPSLEDLHNDNISTHRSLGIVKPDVDSLRFKIRPASSGLDDDKHIADRIFEHQQSLLEQPLTPIPKPSHSFIYEYTHDGHNHVLQIHDWEVQAAFHEYKRQYGSEEKALEMLKQEYQENIPKHNLHFIMGTMQKRPRTFILIGLLRSGLDPSEVLRQETLF